MTVSEANPAPVFGFEGIRGAIFDLDGTLIDSLGVWARIDRDFFLKRGMTVPEDYEQAVSSMSFTQGAVYTRERFGLAQSVAEIEREWHEMAVQEYAHHIECKPGALRLIEYLKARSMLIALATASGEQLYEPVLRRHGLYSRFDAFTTLREVSRAKDYPDIYLLAAQKLGLQPSECVVFEDLPEGIASAGGCGMKTVGVCERDGTRQAGLVRQTADLAVCDFNELFD